MEQIDNLYLPTDDLQRFCTCIYFCLQRQELLPITKEIHIQKNSEETLIESNKFDACGYNEGMIRNHKRQIKIEKSKCEITTDRSGIRTHNS